MSKRTRKPAPAQPKVQHEVVDPRWLLKAGAITLLVALLCAYGTLCLLFYQGQWQFALQPSHTVTQTPTSLGLQFEPVRFGVDASGTPSSAAGLFPPILPSGLTVLMLHGGNGSIADALPSAKVLHTARLNLLLFDYRGFGASGGGHPTEERMQIDAESALDYLVQTRHIALDHIVPYGDGVGASLATRLAAQHHELPALVLESPVGDIDASVAHDPRSKLIPTGLLLHEHFPLAGTLSTLKTPKLIINFTNNPPSLDARQAADPKMTAEFAQRNDATYVQTLGRFLDLYAPNSIPTLNPIH